jgi:hypothetical protein
MPEYSKGFRKIALIFPAHELRKMTGVPAERK